MSNIRFDYSKALPFVGQHEIDNMAEYVKEAHNMLHNKTGAGNDFLGWVNLPTDYDKEEFARIKKAAEKIRSDSDVLVVIGIGGSYLGARAAVEMLQHSFYNALDKDKGKGPAGLAGLFLLGGRGDGEVKVPFLGRRWCVRRYWKVRGGDFVSI